MISSNLQYFFQGTNFTYFYEDLEILGQFFQKVVLTLNNTMILDTGSLDPKNAIGYASVRLDPNHTANFNNSQVVFHNNIPQYVQLYLNQQKNLYEYQWFTKDKREISDPTAIQVDIMEFFNSSFTVDWQLDSNNARYIKCTNSTAFRSLPIYVNPHPHQKNKDHQK